VGGWKGSFSGVSAVGAAATVSPGADGWVSLKPFNFSQPQNEKAIPKAKAMGTYFRIVPPEGIFTKYGMPEIAN
jgi:hypothetical protein